jgi:hypothetical protein
VAPPVRRAPWGTPEPRARTPVRRASARRAARPAARRAWARPGFFEGPPPDAGAGGGAGIDASGVDGASADAPTATDATFEAGAGGAADAAGEGGAVTSGPCAAIPINAPAAAVTNVDTGKAIDLAGFTGGALESGTYWLTSVAHFGAAYVGTTQEIFVIDATAKTVEDAYIPTAGGPVYRAFTYAGVTATTLTGTPICGTTATLSAYYTFAGSGRGATFSVSPFGTSDVKVYTKQ